MPNPSISVVIPVFNRGPLIGPTLDSVLNQTLAAGEILVVDDGSTDGSADWIEAHYRGRVRVIRQSNGGVARARNRGLEEARGDFLAFLDHDDLWRPDKLRAQSEALREHPGAGVVYCAWDHFDQNGVLPPSDLRVWEPRWFDGQKPVDGQKRLREALLIGGFIVSMSVPLVCTQALRDVGGFDPSAVPSDDWDVWIRLSQRVSFVGLRDKLVLYRQHEDQQSRGEASMERANRFVRWKNRRFYLRHPRAWPALLRPRSFARARAVYGAVKEALFARCFGRAWGLSLRCLARRPLLLLTPEWMVLLTRLLRRDARRF